MKDNDTQDNTVEQALNTAAVIPNNEGDVIVADNLEGPAYVMEDMQIIQGRREKICPEVMKLVNEGYDIHDRIMQNGNMFSAVLVKFNYDV